MVSVFRPKKIDLSAKGFQKIFGELEARIMDILWKKGTASIAEVRDELEKKYKDLSFNSVMTVMNRLVAKKVLGKRSQGKISVYFARFTKEELGKIVAKDMITAVFKDPQLFGAINFVDVASDLDDDTLKKLRMLLETYHKDKKDTHDD